MPIYEFYCPDCHAIYSFLSRRVETERVPRCPICDYHPLSRRVSLAAVISKREDSEDRELDDLPVDEKRLEEAVMSLASEAESINENDPRQIARLMRKLADKTGLRYNDTIEEALSRLEAGEDPEALEEEFGDALDGDELPFEFAPKMILKSLRKPRKDEGLYDFDQYCT